MTWTSTQVARTGRLLAMLMSIAPAASVAAQSSKGITSEIVLEGGNQPRSMTDTLSFDVMYRNDGPARLIYTHLLIGRGIKLGVLDRNGLPVTPSRPQFPPLPGPPPVSNSLFFELGNEQVFGVRLSNEIRELVSGPGTYTIYAVTSPPVPPSLASGPDVLTWDDQIRTDNSITFTVR